jgi:hypothetical protein
MTRVRVTPTIRQEFAVTWTDFKQLWVQHSAKLLFQNCDRSTHNAKSCDVKLFTLLSKKNEHV